MDVPVTTPAPDHPALLRQRAAARLGGAAAALGPTARATDALSVLHTLAGSPATASQALTLLHELQLHQVELDLQAQELHASRADLEEALRQQIALYDHQPVGSFTIDMRAVLHGLNQTGAGLLGTGQSDALGLPLDAFFDADSARRFRVALAGLGAVPVALGVTLVRRDQSRQAVLASIGRHPAAGRCLVSLAATAQAEADPPRAG